MICRPPKYSTAAWPRLAIRKITGNRNENVRADLELLLEHGVGRRDRSAPARAARARTPTTFRPATFSCSTVFSALSRIWTAMNSGWAIAPKTEEHDEGDRQDRQHHQRQRAVAEPQDDQRGDQQHERLHRHDQALADEQPHLLDVVGGADHQLAGLVAIVVAERQALDLGEELVAEVEGDVLRDALGVVLLAVRRTPRARALKTTMAIIAPSSAGATARRSSRPGCRRRQCR